MHRSFVTFVPLVVVVSALCCPHQSLAFVVVQTQSTSQHACRAARNALRAASAEAIASLPPLSDGTSDNDNNNDNDGCAISAEALADRLAGKRVALYFSAGWCPMCTSFEPALVAFRKAAEDSGKPVELLYVPSDRSDEDAGRRAAALGMMAVGNKERAADLKKRFRIWAGSESLSFGFGRRSGVPALVVLDSKAGDELAFLPAESRGASALAEWPLDDESNGVW